MGIGNTGSSGKNSNSTSIWAHYPSWGSETSPSMARASPALMTHYPSWGSETVAVAHGGALLYDLITPHGDRKRPGRARRSPMAMRSHYPSWGSETSSTFAPYLVVVHHSLPLMGIGNGRRVERGDVAGVRLITPHGDRKLTCGICGQHLRIPSLPLMGIGNLSRSSPPLARGTLSHYPSWGSET